LAEIAISQNRWDNSAMSTSQSPFFESALALPQAERADLAFQLLQSLELPGDEVDSAAFGEMLRGRVEAHRRGEISSSSLEEARAIIERRLSEGKRS
jgi:putative addiction module component (TIGR02574 family)